MTDNAPLAPGHDGLQLSRLGRGVLSARDQVIGLSGVLREAFRRRRAGYDLSCDPGPPAREELGAGRAGGVSLLREDAGRGDAHAGFWSWPSRSAARVPRCDWRAARQARRNSAAISAKP